jgi:hypothetical protein
MLIASACSRSAITSVSDVETLGTIFRGINNRREKKIPYIPRNESMRLRMSMTRIFARQDGNNGAKIDGWDG